MHQRPVPAPISTLRRWTPAEDALLYQLRTTEHRSWADVAAILNRTTQATAAHYYSHKIAQYSSFEDWNAAIDEQIIDGRRQGLTAKEICVKIGMPAEAVQGRWYELQQQKKVPEDALAVWRRKREVEWSEEEDETILQGGKDGKNEEQFVKSLKFERKYTCDVRQRYRS